MHTLLHDLRYSARQLIKIPGFTLTAVISLALGIGAATAVFSLIYAVLMHPYPYPAADRIVRLTVDSVAGSGDPVYLNGAEIQTLRQSPVVESVLASDNSALMLTGQDLPETVHAVSLISNNFQDLGVPALLGRGLLAIRRSGRPGATTCCSSFLQVLAETLLVQSGCRGSHSAT
jgi:MacB-like protein